MKRLHRIKLAGALTLAVAVGASLAGCASDNSANTGVSDTSQGVAATLTIGEDTTEIGEKIITEYIENFRETTNLSEDDAWGEWMAANGFTPETVRDDVIQYYARDLMIRAAADEKGVTVEQSEIDEQLNDVKGQFEGDEQWQQALDASGLTEEEYRDTVIEPRLLEQKLSEAVAAENTEEVTDDQVLALAQENVSQLDGSKKSSQILFGAEDEQTAREVLDRINSGDLTFEDAVNEYSTDEASKANGGDMGWDSLVALPTSYYAALENLELDQVSDLVYDEDGIRIIKCTEVLSVPEDGYTSLDQVPADFVELFRSQASAMASTTFSDWFAEYAEAATLDINPMPGDVPYNIDMSKYQSEAALEGAGVEDGDVIDETLDESVETIPEGEGATESDAEQGDNALGAEGDQPNGEQPNGEQPEGEQPNGEQPNGDQANGEQPEGEQPNGEQPNGDQANGEQPTTTQNGQQ